MTFCGSPEYMSPEMILEKKRSHMIDYYSIGAVLYEFAIGCPPFYSEDQQKMFEEIKSKPIDLEELEGLSSELTDLILGLLEKDPTQRIGSQYGLKELVDHPFFEVDGFESNEEFWYKVYHKELEAPPILIPHTDEEYHQIVPFSLNSLEEQELLFTGG